jgi:hypothetical protein
MNEPLPATWMTTALAATEVIVPMCWNFAGMPFNLAMRAK